MAGEGVVVRGRVEIDMRQPFRSVKEAVMLFGEKVLAGEIYANKRREMQTKISAEHHHQSKMGMVTAELEETKQSLEKSKEEENLMAHYLHSLKWELEQTKKEIQQLKGSRELEHKPPPSIDPEIEELKYIENTTSTKVEIKTQTEDGFEFEKKRSVKFANPPLLTRVIINKDDHDHHHEGVESSPSDVEKKSNPPLLTRVIINKDDHDHHQEGVESNPSDVEKKFKRKPLIPLFGLLFSKKKGHQKSTGLPRT